MLTRLSLMEAFCLYECDDGDGDGGDDGDDDIIKINKHIENVFFAQKTPFLN